jgi:hypothetical protein
VRRCRGSGAHRQQLLHRHALLATAALTRPDRAEAAALMPLSLATDIPGEFIVLSLDASKLRAEVKLEPAAPVVRERCFGPWQTTLDDESTASSCLGLLLRGFGVSATQRKCNATCAVRCTVAVLGCPFGSPA